MSIAEIKLCKQAALVIKIRADFSQVNIWGRLKHPNK